MILLSVTNWWALHNPLFDQVLLSFIIVGCLVFGLAILVLDGCFFVVSSVWGSEAGKSWIRLGLSSVWCIRCSSTVNCHLSCSSRHPLCELQVLLKNFYWKIIGDYCLMVLLNYLFNSDNRNLYYRRRVLVECKFSVSDINVFHQIHLSSLLSRLLFVLKKNSKPQAILTKSFFLITFTFFLSLSFFYFFIYAFVI